MAKAPEVVSYKVYWVTWFVLLVITIGMILIGSAFTPKLLLVLALLEGMFVKASLISGYFMHLRFEKLTLILVVAVGILFTASVLFFLIAPDGMRILRLSSH